MKPGCVSGVFGRLRTGIPHSGSLSPIPALVKKRLGIRETLLRIFAGIDDVEDLWEALG